MTPLTRSSATPDALLQAISGIQESLLNITSELKSLKTDLNAVQQVILTLKTDLDNVQSSIAPFPTTLATLENKMNNVTEESTTRIDSLLTADLALELDKLHSLTNDAKTNPDMTLTDADIKQIITFNIDKKLQTLPSIIKQEIDNSPIIKNLPTSSTAQLHQALLDLHKQPKSYQKNTGFHQPESKDFHVSKFLKLLETHTLTGDSLQDLEIFYDIIISHLATVTLNSNILPTFHQLTPSFCFQDHLCCPKHNLHSPLWK
jgi:prefoldin subunit 5